MNSVRLGQLLKINTLQKKIAECIVHGEGKCFMTVGSQVCVFINRYIQMYWVTLENIFLIIWGSQLKSTESHSFSQCPYFHVFILGLFSLQKSRI